MLKYLLFIVAVCLVAVQGQFSGTWTSSYSRNPAEKFYICHDTNTGLMEGMYSQVVNIYNTSSLTIVAFILFVF